MPATEQQTEYKDLFTIEEPIEVWTPNGSYRAPRRIDTNKMPVNTTLPEVILEVRGRNPRQRILTSGEWYRIRENLQRTNAEAEEGMITGPYERTSTILDYTHGEMGDKNEFCAGLLIQIPEVDDEGNLATDEKGILKARHIWEMALPIKPGHIKSMPSEFDTYINIIFGMEEARETLPDNAYFYMENPEGLINLLRGRWRWRDRESGRVYVDGDWGPLSPNESVAARAAVEGRVIYELDDVDFKRAMGLLKNTKDAPAREVENNINEVEGVLNNAKIRQEEI